MTTSVAVSVVGEVSTCTTAGAVSTKLWILDKIEVAMSHYSSKINYRGATSIQLQIWKAGVMEQMS